MAMTFELVPAVPGATESGGSSRYLRPQRRAAPMVVADRVTRVGAEPDRQHIEDRQDADPTEEQCQGFHHSSPITFGFARSTA
jgi:hypothetical protein